MIIRGSYWPPLHQNFTIWHLIWERKPLWAEEGDLDAKKVQRCLLAGGGGGGGGGAGVHWAENWDRDAQSLGSWHPPASGTPWHLPWDTGMDRETPQCPMTLQLKDSFKTFYLNKLKFKIQKQFQNLTSWGLIVAAVAGCQTGWHFASKGCNQLWPIGPHPPPSSRSKLVAITISLQSWMSWKSSNFCVPSKQGPELSAEVTEEGGLLWNKVDAAAAVVDAKVLK